MKSLTLLFLLFVFLSSCSKKNYLERSDEDRALQDAIRRVNKNANDENAAEAIPILYSNIKKTHLAKIKSYSTSVEISRWNNIIKEYEYLENAYTSIINSTPAFKLVTPESYSAQILETKTSAAEQYYLAGIEALSKIGRNNLKKAYDLFNKAAHYVEDYKDTEIKMKEAYDKAMIDVVINPVKDNSFDVNNGIGSINYNYNNENLQQTLAQYLRSNNDSKNPAKIYTDRDAYRENIRPDWTVDITVKKIDLPYPSISSYSRTQNKKIQIGTDTSGTPIYQSVSAIINIVKSSFIASIEMDVLVKDIINDKDISFKTHQENYRWEKESGTYTGDRRALSTTDLDIINNNSSIPPTKDFIIGELYKQIYSRIRYQVSGAVSW